MIAFIVIALIACAALLYVSAPLRRPGTTDAPPLPKELEAAIERKRLALVGILDMEEEREAGKLMEPDYEGLRARYEAEAFAALRALEKAGADRDAELEAEIAALKASLICPGCGEVRSPGASCSACGAR